MQVGEYYVDPVDGEVKPVRGANAQSAFRAADDEVLRRAAAARAANPALSEAEFNARVSPQPQATPSAGARRVMSDIFPEKGGIRSIGRGIGGALAGAGSAAASGGRTLLRGTPLLGAGVSAYDVGRTLTDDEMSGYDKAADVSESISRGAGALAGGGIGSVLGGPVGAFIGGTAGYVAPGLIIGGANRRMNRNEQAPEAAPRPAGSALDPAFMRLDASSGDALSESIRRGALGDKLYDTLESASEPVRLPAQAVEQAAPTRSALQQVPQQQAPQQAVAQQPQQELVIQPNEQTVRAATDTFGLQELQDENEAISRLADAYQQRTGQAIPQELSAMDKFQVLAKGLGIGLLVAAFPGFGVAAGLGLGLAAGGDELGKRRGALAAGAQQGFENDQTNLANVMEMAKARRENLLDQISIRTGAEERAEQTRQFDVGARQTDRELGLKERDLAVQSQRLATQGYQQTVDGTTGEVVFVHPTRAPVRTGVTAPPQAAGRGALGVAYNPLEDIRAIADQMDPAIPYAKRMDAAARQAAGYAQGFNAGVPGFPPVATGGDVEPRLAPDGNYYIPDPSRPGKYIQVSQ